MKNIIIVIALLMVSAGLYAGWDKMKKNEINTGNTIKKENMTNQNVIIKTNKGDIEIELFGDKAPNTVANFKKLASEGFYDGIKFHRVIKGFMIQGGDPLSKDESKRALWGTGGPGYQFADELTGQEKYPQGTFAMANAGPNTNGSQFFIVTASPEAPLPPAYTVFGKVVNGMNVALNIEKVETAPNEQPLENIVIEKVEFK
ncbi:MAG: peptidylprolyl isomerase [Patescibacteria group bacterium]